MNKFLPKTSKNTSGFTLVELLVVIAIIAILAAIGLTIYSGAQKNARDGRRRSDIQAISQAIESRYVAGTGYTFPWLASWFANNTFPADPDGSAYVWSIALSVTGYKVCANLEVGTPTSFCLANQQQ